MRVSLFSLLLLAACAADAGSLYEGARLPRAETALVEVNSYSQKRTLRWVITRVSVPDGPSTRGTFEITPGRKRLEVEWRIYDATEKPLVGALFVPFADVPKRLDDGVTEIDFEAEAGRFYRLQWTSRDGASIEGDPRDMELTLVPAGLRPVEAK